MGFGIELRLFVVPLPGLAMVANPARPGMIHAQIMIAPPLFLAARIAFGYVGPAATMPVWRNGRRTGLKIFPPAISRGFTSIHQAAVSVLCLLVGTHF
jgi:hypothetical protein